MVKEDAPELLRRELMAKSWKPVTLAFSGVTDCYQPIERKLEADPPLPGSAAPSSATRSASSPRTPRSPATPTCSPTWPATTPRRCSSRSRRSTPTWPASWSRGRAGRRPGWRRWRRSTEAGVPVGVMIAPVIPGLTDHETPAILAACRDAGARSGRVRDAAAAARGRRRCSSDWLDRHAPAQKEKVLGRIREMRGGRLYDSRFGNRQRGEGEWAEVYPRLVQDGVQAGRDQRAGREAEHGRIPPAGRAVAVRLTSSVDDVGSSR